MKWVAPLLVAVLGIAVVMLGGADDSPGLQGIGGLIAAGAAVLFVRAARRGNHN